MIIYVSADKALALHIHLKLLKPLFPLPSYDLSHLPLILLHQYVYTNNKTLSHIPVFHHKETSQHFNTFFSAPFTFLFILPHTFPNSGRTLRSIFLYYLEPEPCQQQTHTHTLVRPATLRVTRSLHHLSPPSSLRPYR